MRKPVIAGNWKISPTCKKMKRLFLILILLVFQNFSGFAQTEGKVSLIVKFDLNHETEILERVIKLEFQQGKLISQKVLFTTDVENEGGVRGIFLDRYIDVSKGTVYDWKPEDDLTFDLKTKRFIDRKTIPAGEKGDPNFFKLTSPDKKKSIILKSFSSGVESLTIQIEGQKDLVVNERFLATTSSKSSINPVLPMTWIDNNTILTQKGNGFLVVISMDGKVTPFLEIPCTKDQFPRFKKTKIGKLIYSCSGEEYRIDIENKSFEKIKFDLDNDFSEEKSVYFYRDEVIGSGGIEEQTTDGYLAVVSGNKRNGFYDSNDLNSVKVWTKFTKEWQVFIFDGTHTEILAWFIN